MSGFAFCSDIVYNKVVRGNGSSRKTEETEMMTCECCHRVIDPHDAHCELHPTTVAPDYQYQTARDAEEYRGTTL